MNTTTPDEAAESDCKLADVIPGYTHLTTPACLAQVWFCYKRMVNRWRALTDPTPLTVEVLVGMGFNTTAPDRYGINVAHNCRLCCSPSNSNWWLFDGDTAAGIRPAPRTAGELRQLIQRLEK